ncbi:MAG: 6-phosphogluconolactonase [Planctomycetaceae bacterium]|nr:6-phosphogluconolactonase [Planctomycetaceae bacterium]
MTLRFPSYFHRRCFLLLATLALVSETRLTPFAAAADPAKPADVSKLRVYIGTYTSPQGSKGIYQTVLNLKTGELSPVELAAEVSSPSFLAIHPTEKSLYAVMEISDFNGKPAGGVGAFSIDAKTGKLKLLNQQSSGGPGPCHIVVDHSGKFALVANYGGGSAGSLPIKSDGSLEAMGSFVQHVGTSKDKSRQEAPHAHSINVDPQNHFAFVADLGLDKVMIYKLDPKTGKLTPNMPAFASVDAGAGPRHFAFHPSGKFAYVINEMHCTVTGFVYDSAKGELIPVQTITTLPNGFDGENYSTAEIQVHPSGRFVYGSNRGHHSIAVFSVDAGTGKLTAVGNQKEGIKTPRNFGVDPTGQFVIVANQDGDSLVVFRVDLATGMLKATGHKVAVPKPVCVKFLPIR